MKKCICASTSFERIELQDIGFDHFLYEDKLTNKTYFQCNNCGTIFRGDNNLRDPFSEDYFQYDMSRLCTQKMNRNRKLTKLVGDIYQPADTFSV